MAHRRTAGGGDTRADARSRILAAARSLFTQRGYAATTMQQIVAEAGTSIGNAYFYFPNKDQLLAELITQCTKQTWDETEAIAGRVTPGPARVGTIIYANLLSMLGENRDLAQLLFLTDRHAGGIEIVREISIARWQPHLTASYPGRTETDRQLAATAIFGANRALVERALSGQFDTAPARLARDMVRWSLRALGSTPPAIEAAIRSATRHRAPGSSPA